MAAKELDFDAMRRIQGDVESLTEDFPDVDFTAVAENTTPTRNNFIPLSGENVEAKPYIFKIGEVK